MLKLLAAASRAREIGSGVILALARQIIANTSQAVQAARCPGLKEATKMTLMLHAAVIKSLEAVATLVCIQLIRSPIKTYSLCHNIRGATPALA